MYSLILSLFASFVTQAQIQEIGKSGPAPVHLVELYTSESCSSCPPADQWLSELKDDSGLWTKFVPVALHVDYWNQLGWKDKFSGQSMTDRQNALARQWATPSVYTPGMIVDGQEWQDWRSTPNHHLPKTNSTHSITMRLVKTSGDEYRIYFGGLDPAKNYQVRIAELGFGLQTDVTGGENSGRQLKHNFVLLKWDAKPLPGKATEAEFSLKRSEVKTSRRAVAAWVELNGNPVPLQAVGGYL